MGTQIVKRVTLAEAGKVADRVAAQTVFDRELARLSEDTRRTRSADLATWNVYLDSAGVSVEGCNWYSDPACWGWGDC